MKNVFFFLCFAIFFACKNENPGAHQTGSVPPTADTAAWVILFDGTSTDQWRAFGKEAFPAQGWATEGDALVVKKAPKPRPEGFGGDIITKQKFGNFELELEFLVSDTANSGIFYFAVEEGDTPIYFNAPEYQILDNETYISTGVVKENTPHLTGDNYDLQSAPADFSKPVGQWNTARILHRNGHVEHWLNGKKTVEYEVGSEQWLSMVESSKFKDYPGYGRAKQGHIGLQDHDYEVKFRNIKIREL